MQYNNLPNILYLNSLLRSTHLLSPQLTLAYTRAGHGTRRPTLSL